MAVSCLRLHATPPALFIWNYVTWYTRTCAVLPFGYQSRDYHVYVPSSYQPRHVRSRKRYFSQRRLGLLCTAVACRKLSAPDDGRVVSDDESFRFGSSVTLTCDSGYQLTGSATRTCQSDGTWDGSPTVCTRTSFHLSQPHQHRHLRHRHHSGAFYHSFHLDVN